MFNLKENECVGFDSRWKVTKVSIESSSQTSGYTTSETAINTVTTSEIETQTIPEETQTVKYDEAKLAEWLSNLYPKIKHELEESLNSQAFNNYEPSLDTVDINAKLVKNIDINAEQEKKGSITGLSWNATGNSLAVTCNLNHKTWCHHNGMVSVFTYNRIDELPDIPQMKLQAQSCVTVLRYHPTLPSIIAGGTFSGEVLIWDTNKEEENVLAKSNCHEEAVTQISWISDVDSENGFLLATSSLDGFINLWSFNFNSSILSITERYKIKAPIFGKGNRKTELPPHIAKKVDRGVIAFDFSKFIRHKFVVGAEGGLVMQCSMLGTQKLNGSASTCPVSDPVYKYYKSHEGELTSVSFSPNRNDLFVTNGTDGQIRIYVIEQENPAQIIYLDSPIQSLSWVPYEEKLLAVCGNKGYIEIYNIKRGKSIPYNINDTMEVNILSSMEINTKRISTVATGTKSGVVQLWTIPWNVYSQNN